VSKTIELFYDYISPYSYLCNSQIGALAERTGAEVVYRPVLNGGLILAADNKPPPSIPAKAGYMMQDLPRWVKRYGVPFAMNPHFPVNTLKALRGAIVAQQEGVFDAYHEGVFRATWVDGVDIADPEPLRIIAEKAGLDGDSFLQRIQDQKVKDVLKANNDEALARGGFGVPTIFVGDQMFFGNDRLDFVEEALA
jgi:2-hydroxychromene-2-carboxylate isomerase